MVARKYALHFAPDKWRIRIDKTPLVYASLPFTITRNRRRSLNYEISFLRLVNWNFEGFLTGAADCTLNGDRLSLRERQE